MNHTVLIIVIIVNTTRAAAISLYRISTDAAEYLNQLLMMAGQ